MVRCLLSTSKAAVLETEIPAGTFLCPVSHKSRCSRHKVSYPHPNFTWWSHFGVKITHNSWGGPRCQEWFHCLELPRKWDPHRGIGWNGESLWEADFCFFLIVHGRKRRDGCFFALSGQGNAFHCSFVLFLHKECTLTPIPAPHCYQPYNKLCKKCKNTFLSHLAHHPGTCQRRNAVAHVLPSLHPTSPTSQQCSRFINAFLLLTVPVG